MTPWQLRQISKLIKMGEVVACPTEGVFGLSCNPLDADAVHYLLDIKQRSIEKGLIVVAADFAQLEPFVAPLPAKIKNRLLKSWPGAITWLVPARKDTPYWITGGHEKIAVRISAHPLLRQICTSLNHTIVSTSANPSKRTPARSALQVRRYFGDQLAMILNGRTLGPAVPTKIVDAITSQVIRP